MAAAGVFGPLGCKVGLDLRKTRCRGHIDFHQLLKGQFEQVIFKSRLGLGLERGETKAPQNEPPNEWFFAHPFVSVACLRTVFVRCTGGTLRPLSFFVLRGKGQ